MLVVTAKSAIKFDSGLGPYVSTYTLISTIGIETELTYGCSASIDFDLGIPLIEDCVISQYCYSSPLKLVGLLC